MTDDFLGAIPLWAMFCGTVLLVLLATELGFWGGQRRSKTAYENNEAQITSMTGAHLGLLAFIMAFSFSVAASHFDGRKRIILTETNAIETAYLRASLVADPPGENIRTLLIDYTELRKDGVKKDTVTAILQGSSDIHTKIWHEIEQLATTEQATVYHSLLVQAVNDVFDLHEERVYLGKRMVIPAIIWIALYSVLLLSMAGVGFHFGIKGARSPVPSAALALSFSMVLFLIADLDRPRDGILTTDQSSMVELYERLNASP